MKGKGIAIIVGLVILFILGSNTVFTINESEQAIITQFGKPVGGKIDNDILPVDILQRIAEDIDRLSTSGAETQFIINNTVDYLHVCFRGNDNLQPVIFHQSAFIEILNHGKAGS